MKLIIQIPCLNEEAQLPATLADLPRSVPGFDEVEWLIIDDGSTDRTVEVAKSHGVDHVVRLTNNKGLASAFQAGIDACLKLGADVIVNTDADNQYSASDIPKITQPIIAGSADMVIGDRQVLDHTEFSPLKRRLQWFGSAVVRRASNTPVPDATSGFRAYNREAALHLVVVNKFTYTLESLIQAGRNLVAVEHVPIQTNPKVRESRLFTSNSNYIRRAVPLIFRIYSTFEPLRVFTIFGFLLLLMSGLAFSPFLYDWIVNGDSSGHIQSIVVGGILFVAAVQIFALGVVADLLAGQRFIAERTMARVKRIELALGVAPSHYEPGRPMTTSPVAESEPAPTSASPPSAI